MISSLRESWLDFPLAAELVRGCAFYPQVTDISRLSRLLGLDQVRLAAALAYLQQLHLIRKSEDDGGLNWDLQLSAADIQAAREAAELNWIEKGAAKSVDVSGRLQWLDSLAAMIECARRSYRENLSKT